MAAPPTARCSTGRRSPARPRRPRIAPSGGWRRPRRRCPWSAAAATGEPVRRRQVQAARKGRRRNRPYRARDHPFRRGRQRLAARRKCQHLFEQFHRPAQHGAVAAADGHGAAAHGGPAYRHRAGAVGRGDPHRRPGTHQDPLLLGLARRRHGRQQRVGARRAAVGRQPVGRPVHPARRHRGRRRLHGCRPRPSDRRRRLLQRQRQADLPGGRQDEAGLPLALGDQGRHRRLQRILVRRQEGQGNGLSACAEGHDDRGRARPEAHRRQRPHRHRHGQREGDDQAGRSDHRRQAGRHLGQGRCRLHHHGGDAVDHAQGRPELGEDRPDGRHDHKA